MLMSLSSWVHSILCCLWWQSQYSSQERLHLGSLLTPEHSPATPSSLTRSRQQYDSNDSSTPLVEAELSDIPSNSSSNSSGVRSPLIRPRSHSLRLVCVTHTYKHHFSRHFLGKSGWAAGLFLILHLIPNLCSQSFQLLKMIAHRSVFAQVN